MAGNSYKKIMVVGGAYAKRAEAVAGGTITPGHVIKYSGAQVVVHATAKGGCFPPMVAEEDVMQGNGISTNYTSGKLVQFVVPLRGDCTNCILSAGENVAVGDLLEMNGDGTFQKFTDGVAVAVAKEALNLSASGAVASRLVVEWL